MRLLIISSEPLNQLDTHSSTFELDQAKILSKLYDVSIISVGIERPLVSQLKEVLKSVLAFPNCRTLCQAITFPLKAYNCILGRQKVNVCTIDGIDIYEGITCHLFKEISFETLTEQFETYLETWLLGANSAFSRYKRCCGLPDLIHAHGRFITAGAIALSLKSTLTIPYIYTEHSSFYRRNIAPSSSKNILKRIIKFSSSFTVVSQSLLKSVEHFIEEKTSNPVILKNTIDHIFEVTEPNPFLNKNPFKYLTIASLDQNKRVDIILNAFANSYIENNQYQLTICGEGPLRKSLEKLAIDLGISEQVTFLGKVSKDNVLREIDDAHALVNASDSETFGVAIVEALSRGRPVIATRCGGPENIVTPENGILIDCNSVSQMEKALLEISINYSVYKPLEIRKTAIQLYGSEAFLNSVVPLYNKALEKDDRR